MVTCAVYGCSNNSISIVDLTIQFYNFPKHPVVMQQWIDACWRPDPIDTNNAQVCSIHFDKNSFTSEYKLIDYSGHYTRILKFDAVPTLYLPQPFPSVESSSETEEAVGSIEIHTGEINLEEMKDIIVYQYENVSNEMSTSNNEIVCKNETVSPDEFVSDDCQDKYNEINNPEKLIQLRNENCEMKQNILKLKTAIEAGKIGLEKKTAALREIQEEMKQLSREYDKLSRKKLSVVDQRGILSKIFSESQLKILSGKKKIYWSNDDLAVGYTIRHLSNKRCYMYITKNLKIPLPATSSIKRWSTFKSNKNDKNLEESESKDDDVL